MNDLDLILCEYQTKFGELIKIVNKISDDSNPSFIKKEIDKFKEEFGYDLCYDCGDGKGVYKRHCGCDGL